MIPFQIDQYLEETALLFTRRIWYVEQPHVGLANLLELDRRIDAQLDGLVEAGAAAWERCCEELDTLQPGECFAAAGLALASSDSSRIAQVIEVADGNQDLVPPVAMAFGWRPWRDVAKLANDWLQAGSWRTAAGLSAHLVHGIDPGDYLANALDDSNVVTRQIALRGVGELGRVDLTDCVANHVSDTDGESANWANWSVGLLRGNAADVSRLVTTVLRRPELAAWFLPVILGRQDRSISRNWQQELQRNGPERLAIALAAQTGDPAAVPWLLEKMLGLKSARIAAEAFTVITGLRVQGESLETPSPPGFESGPTDDPEDEAVTIDSDEYLQWPNVDTVASWWNAHAGSFTAGERYLLGRPQTEDGYWRVVRNGKQRERFQAALNLALSPIGRKLFDVRAPSVLQFSRLSATDPD